MPSLDKSMPVIENTHGANTGLFPSEVHNLVLQWCRGHASFLHWFQRPFWSMHFSTTQIYSLIALLLTSRIHSRLFPYPNFSASPVSFHSTLLLPRCPLRNSPHLPARERVGAWLPWVPISKHKWPNYIDGTCLLFHSTIFHQLTPLLKNSPTLGFN